MKTLTESERLQMIGLVTLAQKYNHQLLSVQAAMTELLDGVGSERIEDRVADAIFSREQPADACVEDLLQGIAYDEEIVRAARGE